MVSPYKSRLERSERAQKSYLSTTKVIQADVDWGQAYYGVITIFGRTVLLKIWVA